MGYALRRPILWASSKPAIKRVITALPPTRALVRRFVAGEHLQDAVRGAVQLREAGILVSIDHLGEHVTTEQQVRGNVLEARRLITALQQAGVASGSEISLKLSALGQELDDELAAHSALDVALSARDAGVLVTIDMEDHTTTDRTLATLRRVREQVPGAGIAIRAAPTRQPGALRPGLCALRRRLARLPDAAPGRETGQPPAVDAFAATRGRPSRTHRRQDRPSDPRRGAACEQHRSPCGALVGALDSPL